MIKILIFIPTFGVGGVLSSLNGFLANLDASKYQIDVFAFYQVGPFYKKLKNCNILDENIWLSASIKHGNLIKKGLFYCLLLIKKIIRIFNKDIDKIVKNLGTKSLNLPKYDIVIAFSETLLDFVCDLNAAKKTIWLHSIYTRYRNMVDSQGDIDKFHILNKIVCVSEFARRDFLSVYPQLSEKTIVIPNQLDKKEIVTKSLCQEWIDPRFKTDIFTIISLGRLDPVKQFSKIPTIARKIKESCNIPFRWYIIGGSRSDKREEYLIKSAIKENDVSNIVIMLGEKTNPYPYLAKSNLFVHTSKSETFGIVISEANLLCIPVIVNDFGCAPEMVKNGENGFIVNVNDMHLCISDILTSPDTLHTVKERLISHNVSVRNEDFLKQLLK